ncbi:MAG: hypothetical protein Q8N39_10415 [Pelolinea sp.]|nr:hypothetical protein [Pelolinea sp.]
MANDFSLERINKLLGSLDCSVIRNKSFWDKKFIYSYYRKLMISEFNKMNFALLGKTTRKERKLLCISAYKCINKTSLGLHEEAINFLKKMFYFNLLSNQLIEAHNSIPNVLDEKTSQRDMLESIWWEVWLKKKNFRLGMLFLLDMPKNLRYERQFIHILENKFGKGFNNLSLKDYKNSWFKLPYSVYSFLVWLTKKIELNTFGKSIRQLIPILISDIDLRKTLIMKANNHLCSINPTS